MTDVALREYLEHQIQSLDRRTQERMAEVDRRLMERFTMSDAAVAKAERTMNERLNSMNEFREALKDQANRMATRVEVERIEQDVEELRRAKANLDGRMIALAGGLSILTSIAMWILSRLTTP